MVGTPLQAVGDFGRAIYTNQEEPSYYWHRAEAYMELSDFDSCIANFRHFNLLLASKNQKSVYVSKIRLGYVLYTWGQILLDQKRYKEALEAFSEVHECGHPYSMVGPRM